MLCNLFLLMNIYARSQLIAHSQDYLGKLQKNLAIIS